MSHENVFIYVYFQFKSEFKENYLALTSLKIPLSKNTWTLWNSMSKETLSAAIVFAADFVCVIPHDYMVPYY